MSRKYSTIIMSLAVISAIGAYLMLSQKASIDTETDFVLRGASSYTPYDAVAMLWQKAGPNREIVWTSSGGESGRLLVSEAQSENRPNWVLCTQGVVAGLVARGKDVKIIGSVYVSDEVLLPVYRKGIVDFRNTRSVYIPRSSIEFAFDNLLQRLELTRSAVRTPILETVGFPAITTMLSKPQDDSGAIDFAILVDPFITNIITQYPEDYSIGQGGLYNMHYCIVVRADDLQRNRNYYKKLMSQLKYADDEIRNFETEDQFYLNVWGRTKDGEPEYLPRMKTYQREPAKLGLAVGLLRTQLREEIEYLVAKYPNALEAPADIDGIVVPDLLQEVSPESVIN